MSENSIDGRFKHPLTAVITGPSGVGKTTFVSQLLEHSDKLFDVQFAYITIYIGTKLEDNAILQQLQEKKENVQIIDIKQLYPSSKQFELDFKKNFLNTCKEKGKKGCIVFDDMMGELSKCGLLSDLFSKHSSHLDLTIIHITQNLFYKGKDPNEHITLYRNTHMLVLFKNPLDSSILSTIARRLGSGDKYKKILSLFHHVLDKERYIIIYGGFKRSPNLQFTSDIFNFDPMFQRVYSISP
jgi:Cdc6-like AAA superfamily ATPase